MCSIIKYSHFSFKMQLRSQNSTLILKCHIICNFNKKTHIKCFFFFFAVENKFDVNSTVNLSFQGIRLQSWLGVIRSGCFGLTDCPSTRVAHLACAQAAAPATSSSVQGPFCGPAWYRPFHRQTCPAHGSAALFVCRRWDGGLTNSSKPSLGLFELACSLQMGGV